MSGSLGPTSKALTRYAGPHFDGQVNFRTGETVERDGFYFLDLIPGNASILET